MGVAAYTALGAFGLRMLSRHGASGTVLLDMSRKHMADVVKSRWQSTLMPQCICPLRGVS